MYMSRDAETISPRDTFGDAIKKMNARQIRRLLVMVGDTVEGVVCKQDLIAAYPDHLNPFSSVGLEDPAAQTRIETIMKGPVITIDEAAPIEHAATLMARHHIGGLAVMDHGNLVGVITESDVFRAFTRLLGGESGSVRITFDVTESEDTLSCLEALIKKHGVELLSFVSLHDAGRRMAVVRVRGGQIEKFIDEIWESDHVVLNVLHLNPDLDNEKLKDEAASE